MKVARSRQSINFTKAYLSCSWHATALENFALPSLPVVLERHDAQVLYRTLLRTRRCSGFYVRLKTCRNSFTHSRMDYPVSSRESRVFPFSRKCSRTWYSLREFSEKHGMLRNFHNSQGGEGLTIFLYLGLERFSALDQDQNHFIIVFIWAIIAQL